MGWIKSLLGLFAALADYFRDRQLIEAGRDQQALEEVKEVEHRVEQAKAVERSADPERDKRLRSRFDRGKQAGGSE